LQIKVPSYWITHSIGKRQLVNKYETNAFIKCIGHYCILKQVTTTGVIHDWKSQSKYLQKLLNLSRNGLLKAIERLQIVGLIDLGANLCLVGWDDASQIIGLEIDEWVFIDYDQESSAKIEHLLLAAEIKINQKNQVKIIQKRLKFNPSLKNELDIAISQNWQIDLKNVQKMNIEEWIWHLKELQISTFIDGTLKASLYEINPDLNRTVVKFKNDWNHKSIQSIAYVKRKLMQLNLITVQKIGAIVSIAKNRIRKMGNYASGYDPMLKLPIWFIPDSIQVNFELKG
jgi:hypothetical protein